MRRCSTLTRSSVGKHGGVVSSYDFGHQSLRGPPVHFLLAHARSERDVEHVAVVVAALSSQNIVTVTIRIHQNDQLEQECTRLRIVYSYAHMRVQCTKIWLTFLSTARAMGFAPTRTSLLLMGLTRSAT